MKRKYVFLGIALLIAAVLVMVAQQRYVQPLLDDRTVTTVVPTEMKSDEYKVSFSFPSGEAGYAIVEPPVATTSESVKKIYLMFDNAQYVEFQKAGADIQTPPAVSVFVFAMPPAAEGASSSRAQRLQQWIEENPQYTSYTRKVTDLQPVEIDGVPGVTYATEGLYKQDFHIASYSGNIYLFAGQYENSDDAIVSMYRDLIESVTFY